MLQEMLIILDVFPTKMAHKSRMEGTEVLHNHDSGILELLD